MKKYKVKITFSFTGEVEILANTKPHAREIADNYFGTTIGHIENAYSSNKENEVGIIDWNFPVHPKKKIHKITL